MSTGGVVPAEDNMEIDDSPHRPGSFGFSDVAGPSSQPPEPMTSTPTTNIPLPGSLAVLRNRSGVITNMAPSAVSPEEIVHLVTVAYADRDGARIETVLWEREPGAKVIPGSGLPRIDDDAPMAPGVFSAMVRANRWTALRPYLDPAAESGQLPRMPLASPLHRAIEPEDYHILQSQKGQ